MPKKNDVTTKPENKKAIFQYLREHGSASRQDILLGLGLSLPTITQALKLLKEDGLIEETEAVRHTGGRNAASYACKADGRGAVGLFLTERDVTAVAVDLCGEVSAMLRERAEASLQKEEYLRKLGKLAVDVKEMAGIADEALVGAGIAVQSLVSEDGEAILFGMAQDFAGVTREVLSRYIPWKTALFHDAYVAGYAEVFCRPELRNAFYLNLNNVAGGAAVLSDRRFYLGDNHRAAEVGHVIVAPDSNVRCYCGNYGCFHTVCGADVLTSCAGGDLLRFFQLVDAGDAEAARRWDSYLGHLSLVIHNLRMLLDCPIILGGYVGASMTEARLDELFRRVDQLDIFSDHARNYLLPCRYKTEATAAGAALRILMRELWG